MMRITKTILAMMKIRAFPNQEILMFLMVSSEHDPLSQSYLDENYDYSFIRTHVVP
jgi:hypothetical protein